MPYLPSKVSRRDFLKYVSAGLGALAFRPFYQEAETLTPRVVSDGAGKVIRITTDNVSVYKEPWDESAILYQAYRNDLLNVYYVVTSEHGPGYNPKWYRVWGGYVHSAYTQVVETHLNEVDYSVINTPLPGRLAEVTVPFTQSRMNRTGKEWEDVFMLYYQSVHWVVGLIDGPDGRPWYRIKDSTYDYDTLDYYVPAEHMRIIPYTELEAISPEIPVGDKRIDVSISKQEMTCYEYDEPVMTVKVSTGSPSQKREGVTPTSTPTGDYNIMNKVPSHHMGEGQITSDLSAYELPGVPWVCYFIAETGVAFHGTYWHDNYGMTMSHGCVNMPTDKAKWLFRWAKPAIYNVEEMKRENIGFGTAVHVH